MTATRSIILRALEVRDLIEKVDGIWSWVAGLKRVHADGKEAGK